MILTDVGTKLQSYSRCDNIKAMLNAMFPGIIPEPFSLSSSKISHLISEAVGPYFKTPNIEDLKKSSPWFTIHFDKTTNKQMRKQLGNKIKFSSEADSAFSASFKKCI